MSEKVSVIIPVYNAELFIERCFHSIKEQSFKDIEIVFVNDGSTDNTLELLNKFAQEDERVIVVSQENKGVGYARNVGLNMSTGDYICFIDADDWVETRMIERLVDVMHKDNDIGIVVCEFDHSCEDEKLPYLKQIEYEYLDRSQMMLFFLENKKIPGMLWAKLFKSGLIKNEQFNSALRYGEDCEFLWRIIKKADQLVIIDEVLYHNVPEKKSLSRTPFTSEQFSIVIIWDSIVRNVQELFQGKSDYELFYSKANETFVLNVIYSYFHMVKSHYKDVVECRKCKEIIRRGGYRGFCSIMFSGSVPLKYKIFAITIKAHLV